MYVHYIFLSGATVRPSIVVFDERLSTIIEGERLTLGNSIQFKTYCTPT